MIGRVLFFSFLLVVIPVFAQEEGTIRGTVVDGKRVVLPGALVRLQKTGQSLDLTTYTATDGKFIFDGLDAGKYQLSAEMPGFQTITADVTLDLTRIAGIEIVLPEEQNITESIEVSGESNQDLLQKDQTQHKQEISNEVMNYTPIASQRFQDALPLVPSVVRGPDGNININGARAAESSLLVNGANVTDPVTGNFATELPFEAVENVQVFTNPYSAEFGKFTGGVTSVSTKGGGDDFKIEFNDFMPRLHFTEGFKTEGLEAWKPRIRLSGPTGINKLYFSQAFHYKYIRTFLEDLPEGRNEIKMNAFDSLTQFDFKLSEKHEATLTLSVFPETTRNVNLNTFLPVASTPDFRQRGFNVAASDRHIFADGSFIESAFSYKSYDVSVLPKAAMGNEFTLSPEGMSGNYFNSQDRQSSRMQVSEAYTLRPINFYGSHIFRVAAEVGETSYDGHLSYNTIDIRRGNGSLFERIRFQGSGDVGHSSTEISTYLQDHWSATNEVIVDWGLRLDRDSLSRDLNFAPRLAVSYSPRFLPRTSFKGGVGLFYDKVFLSASDFEDYPTRIVEHFDGQGQLINTTLLENRLNSDIKTPVSMTWNIEVDQEINPKLVVRSNFLMRRARNQFMIEPRDGVLSLSNEGRSRYWEWEFTSQYRFSKDDNLYFSYVRSKTKGDSNDFDTYLGNFQKPVIRENEFTELPFDAPNRFLIWGVLKVPYKVFLSPVLEVRNGFPYSMIDETQNYVGERNSLRFPVFAQLDLRVTRTFRVFGKYNVRAGMKVFNVLNRFNPRDVQNNIDSPSFGSFYNGVGRTFRGTFEIEY